MQAPSIKNRDSQVIKTLLETEGHQNKSQIAIRLERRRRIEDLDDAKRLRQELSEF